ncbi:MAG: hypothetical protein EOO23_02350 [Comamonadaceae bacterium]|nr:MAG: hypothetical protein EOO23_02350 [Comamonadaceae bacterium]
MDFRKMIRRVNFVVTLAGAAVLAGCGGGGTNGIAPATVALELPTESGPVHGHSDPTPQTTDPTAPATVALERTTESGPVRGYRDPTTQTLAWLGLPYAKAPIGALRWKASVAPESWTAVRDASKFGPSCAQGGRYFSPAPGNAPFGLSVRDGFGKVVGSEDCLTLNVWRPAASEGRLPVLFFIHGGSNISGYSADPIYHGAQLAQQADAVVITVNYRLGLLGWLDME